MKRIQVHFTETQLTRLAELEPETGLKVRTAIRVAVDEYLSRHPKKPAAKPEKGKRP